MRIQVLTLEQNCKEQVHYTGSLIDERDNPLVCLLNREDDASVGHFKSSIDEIASQMRNKHHTQVTAGLGHVATRWATTNVAVPKQARHGTWDATFIATSANLRT